MMTLSSTIAEFEMLNSRGRCRLLSSPDADRYFQLVGGSFEVNSGEV